MNKIDKIDKIDKNKQKIYAENWEKIVAECDKFDNDDYCLYQAGIMGFINYAIKNKDYELRFSNFERGGDLYFRFEDSADAFAEFLPCTENGYFVFKKKDIIESIIDYADNDKEYFEDAIKFFEDIANSLKNKINTKD